MLNTGSQKDFIPSGTFFGFVNERQLGWIRFSIEEWRNLQRIFSEISDDYRAGLSCSEIAKKHGLYQRYSGNSKSTVQNIVRLALKWYSGELDLFQSIRYPWLIPSGEYEQIAMAVYRNSRHIIGMKNKENGLWINRFSKEQRSEMGRRSCLKQMKLGIGIHAQSKFDKKEAWRLGAKAQGKVPWSETEEQRILVLASEKEFQRKTRINAQKIALILNEEFHEGVEIRDNNSVKKAYMRVKISMQRILDEKNM